MSDGILECGLDPPRINASPANAQKTLRVLQVDSIFNGGGVDAQLLELIRGLLAADTDITLAVRADNGLISQARAIPGLRLQILPARRFAFIRALARDIRAWRPDIVHAHHGRDHWSALMATWLAGNRPRVVVSRHLMRVNSAASRTLLLRCTDVVAVSRAVHAVLAASLCGPREHLHQIHGGVDCAHFRPVSAQAAMDAKTALGFGADDVVFTVLGYFNPPRGKGQLEFLRSAAHLHAHNPQTRFLIVGTGGLLAPLQAFILANGLGNVARIVGWQTDVRGVLAATDVLVCPAVEPEAMAMTLWEAMACGRPVIASRLGGMPEAFQPERHGLLVPASDIAALTAAMSRMASDAGLRARWGTAARRYVQDHGSTSAFARRMLALYREILQREHRAPAPAA